MTGKLRFYEVFDPMLARIGSGRRFPILPTGSTPPPSPCQMSRCSHSAPCTAGYSKIVHHDTVRKLPYVDESMYSLRRNNGRCGQWVLRDKIVINVLVATAFSSVAIPSLKTSDEDEVGVRIRMPRWRACRPESKRYCDQVRTSIARRQSCQRHPFSDLVL